MTGRGVFSKMVATYTLIISLSLVIIAGFLSYWFKGYYLEEKKRNLISQSDLIQSIAIQYIDGEKRMEEVNTHLMVIGQYLNEEVLLIDNYGYVFASSMTKHEGLIRKQILIKELEELRRGHAIEKINAEDGVFGKQSHIFAIPIQTIDNEFRGAIIMNTPMSELNASLNKVYEIIWLSAIFAIIGSCIILYYFSQKIIIKPLEEINSVAKKISNGDVDKRVYIKSNDEIGELANSFNSMADSLETVEKNRRQFISNVAHEIRSPITSIKGFISGILDGIIPKEKEKYYLSIAYEEIQRLTRLINDLLDLSAIDAGEFKLKINEIDINEIIRITVIKNETRIREKNLKVDVCFNEDRLFIAGDKDRLVQVITNLLDNAIKYVPEAGVIKISSKAKGKKAYITVFNNGESIPSEDLKHIWDRFYKVDKSRTVKESTGLGLSIVRNIITQLQEDIWVENKDNGVSFTFTLTRVK